jgi:cytochrome c oxidase assembly protein subunit 15
MKQIALIATVLALIVVVLGAYVRLSDAGLGCPDWPGCYGNLIVPGESSEIDTANQAYPERPVEAHKAWKEMVHRYAAGTLGLLVLALWIMALRHRKESAYLLRLTTVLAVVIVFQAILGMWTVTLQLKPVVVMGHLLGGFTTLGLLWWLLLSTREGVKPIERPRVNGAVLATVAGLLILVMQIALGGWTSSNYAAMACPDFPRCQTQWLPPMDFKEGFVLWRGLGINYEFGVLESPARTAIHFTHRLGAIVTTIYLGFFAVWLLFREQRDTIRMMAITVLVVLLSQVVLGISNIIFKLPLPVAVAHNAGAALLLLSLLATLFFLTRTGSIRSEEINHAR